MPKETIFCYIQQHIDDDGYYTDSVLPDDPQPLIPRPLGMEDALFYSGMAPQDDFGLPELIKALDKALALPSERNCQELCQVLDNLHIASIYDNFIKHYTEQPPNEGTLRLGKFLFYKALTREQLKFSLLLLGFAGMKTVYEQQHVLWQDLVTAARCEEFTVYFVNACTLTEFCPNEDYWQLVNCVHNWGRVSLLQELWPRTQEERLWLIAHGYEISISYPDLAPRLASLSQLQNVLEGTQLNETVLMGALTIINNLLLLISGDNPQELQEEHNLSGIQLNTLIYHALYHSSTQPMEPLLALELLQLNGYLRSLAEDQEWTYLTANDCHRLIANCDQLIYSRDWTQDISEKLITADGPDYLLADVAYELEQDIWEPLYQYFVEHPQEINLLPYLLAYEGDHRSEQVLSQIEKNYRLYADNQEALVVPLRYLKDHPGQGENIICQALTGMFDFPRGYACAIINYWGPEYMTPRFQDALKIALRLNQHKIVNSHIQDLIAGIYQPPEPGFDD